jgi:FixJ family two-component response regulator
MRIIAVVEDNPSMLQGLNRLLSAHGFCVHTFTSAELFLDDIDKWYRSGEGRLARCDGG